MTEMLEVFTLALGVLLCAVLGIRHQIRRDDVLYGNFIQDPGPAKPPQTALDRPSRELKR